MQDLHTWHTSSQQIVKFITNRNNKMNQYTVFKRYFSKIKILMKDNTFKKRFMLVTLLVLMIYCWWNKIFCEIELIFKVLFIILCFSNPHSYICFFPAWKIKQIKARRSSSKALPFWTSWKAWAWKTWIYLEQNS